MNATDDRISLVTGCSGFIGRRVLQPRDRGMYRNSAFSGNGVIADLSDPGSLLAACDGVATVFHCAGYAHAFTGSNADLHWAINFRGTQNLLEAAVRAGVERFVFLSSVKAMADPGDMLADESLTGDPTTAYGQAKRAAEQAVLEAGDKHGMHVVNLRLTMVYGRGGHGNLERMAGGIKKGWFPPLPETGNRRSLVHVNDVVSAMRVVAARPEANGRTFIVAGPFDPSGRELYDAIRRVLGLPPRRFSVPEVALQAAAAVGDATGALLGRSLPINSEVLSRLLGSARYSTALIERELGWHATIGLEEGLREMLTDEARH